jgi:hypothetical protein
MKIYLLVIILFFILYLAYNFKEGFEDSDTYGYKPSYDLNTYCKNNTCEVRGKNEQSKLYIKNPSTLLPLSFFTPFIVNFYNMLKNCKLNSNCYAEKSKVLKDELNIHMEPNKDGYLNFICDKEQIRSVTLNRINYEMGKSTDNIKHPGTFPVKTRVQIQNIQAETKLNGMIGTIIPFNESDDKYWADNYRVLFDERPELYDTYKTWCDGDESCTLINGVSSDVEGESMVLKSDYFKNVSGAWWNPLGSLEERQYDPDESYFKLSMFYDDLITMANSANDGKKEVCKCIGDKMLNHINKYTINGSSNDAIKMKDNLNIESCN